MTNQQKIEFYLSKGFAVKIIKNGGQQVVIFGMNNDGSVIFMDENRKFCFGEATVVADTMKYVSEVTPIPPKPYEFSVGERVLIFATGEIGKISDKDSFSDKDSYKYWIDGQDETYSPYELAPALPEEEECEVVEVVEFDDCLRGGKEFMATKPDGKKLKIKVVEKQ